MPKLIYASTDNSDMFYKVRYNIADPFFYLELENKNLIFLDHRDIWAFKEKNKTPQLQTVLLNDFIEKAKNLEINTSETNKIALAIFKEYKLLDKEIQVPESFPIGLADFLRSQGIKITPISPFIPNRQIKTKAEIQYIKGNINKTLKAFQKIEHILKESEIKWDKLYFEGNILTSEFLKFEVEKLFLEENMYNTKWIIISSSLQTAVPHNHWSWEIKPNSLIICDIYPKNMKNGYFADITRTYLKWKATQKMLDMFEAVKEAQKQAIKEIKPWIQNKEIHKICEDTFNKRWFKTENGSGFIHWTWHSFGLDIHEKPNLNSTSEEILKPWNILTVEPWLYYPELGGIRIEDDILVTENGCENLVNYPKI